MSIPSNDLLRSLAPISVTAWAEIEKEAKRTLVDMLAGRKLVDFSGPHGWQFSAVDLGRTRALAPPPQPGMQPKLRRVQPLLELHMPFEVSREELNAIDRGARDPDLGPEHEAARKAALAEDSILFHGYEPAGIQGIMQAAAERRLPIGDDFAAYPALVAEAVQRLRSDGVDGPFAIALGPRCFAGLGKTTVNGYPVIGHLRRLVDGPIISAPGIDGATVLSTRGGDFELTVGRDWSIGYLDHSASAVSLYLVQSFTFQVLSAEAAVPLTYKASAKAA